MTDLIAERFELERVAGEGGMGTVYRARDRHTGEAVALKVVKGRLTSSVGQRFYREAQLLGTLAHPGIVRHVAHGTTGDGEMWLAMEWLEGEDLEVRLRRGWQPSLTETLRLVGQAARALGAAHARGVVHRDIKPGNLFLVGKPAQVRIVDFGLARAQGLSQLTETGMILGTPSYMAPEQARGDAEVDARCDVYALGCVLFELLTGRPPFTGSKGLAVLMKTLLEEAPRLSAIDTYEEVPDGLEKLVARVLAKDPEDRPANGDALAGALEAVEPSSVGTETDQHFALQKALTALERRVVSVVAAGGRWLGRTAVMGANPTPPRDARDSWSSLRRAVEHFDARLERLVDGTLVVTMIDAGLPTEQAVRAARCALTLQSVKPDVPVVVATGRTLTEPGRRRAPLGEVIERAVERLYRLRAAAIGIDEGTAGLLPPRFQVTGPPDALLLTVEREDTPEVRTLLGRPTRCIGRRRELGQLVGSWEYAVGEPGAVAVLVTAPAGVGKSRLAHELLQELSAEDAPSAMLFARGDALAAESAYATAGVALRRWCGIRRRDAPETRRSKLRARLTRHVDDEDTASRIVAFLGEAVGVPLPADEAGVALRAARRDARLMADQVRAAFVDWARAEASIQPVLLVLDDLQWGDRPSLQLVDAALEALEEHPFMVLGLGRPGVDERHPDLWADRDLTRLALRGLSRRAAEQLTRDALGPAVADALVARVVEQADGNAFYLEELIRTAAQDPAGALPDTVLGMVETRVASLGPDSRRILRAASVYGQTFRADAVVALVSDRADLTQVRTNLDDLVTREVITFERGERDSDVGRYRFRSGLLREAAYAMLTEDDRGLGHRLAGQWLAAKGPADPLALAEHFRRGDRADEAAGWYVRAAKDALDGNDIDAASAHAERALACGARGESLTTLRLVEAEARIFRGDIAGAIRSARALADLVEPGAGPWFRAIGYLTYGHSVLGQDDALDACHEELEGVAMLGEDPLPAVIAWTQAAYAHDVRGRYRDAADCIAEAERAARATSTAEARPLVDGRLAGVRAHMALHEGDIALAAQQYAVATESYLSCGYLRRAVGMRTSHGFCFTQVGQWAAAREQLEQAVAEADRLALGHVAANARHNLGLVLARQGALEEGRQKEQEAIDALAAEGDVRMEGAARAYLAEILLLSGDAESALAEAERSVEALEPFPPVLVHALAVLSAIRLARGEPDAALAASRRAMGHLLAVGEAEEGESLLRLIHAQALFARGDRNGAVATIGAARDRLLERSARISDRTLRASFLHQVPESARTLELAERWSA